ncbi:uncharacterized protein KY384_008481 [Bacidia gigantensis]|uniref:uncharacterized protein n=1 Tax=Bacidia gigantensis TaxID=2732470 RepID=UPI001D03D149|nr:uncharacterized protein KY384_008481 [Bacidia gigantensis]KAG8527052.1 hypothetical protein KY384_008481 [Bacidia gigantensis]
MQRPKFIDLRSQSQETMQTAASATSPRPFPSPRMQHFDGDIPPAMSPLDMFAAQSRLLAKQLDESMRSGRRVSRLPPLSTTDPITKQRRMFQGSKSAGQTPPDSARTPPPPKEEESSGTIPELEEPQFRPKSFYPRMSHVPPMEEDDLEGPSEAASLASTGNHSIRDGRYQQQQQQPRANDYFGMPVAESPMETTTTNVHTGPSHRDPMRAPQSRHQDSAYQPFNFNEPHRGMSVESSSSKASSRGQQSLLPPKSPHMKQASIRSIPADSSDDDNSASTTGSGFSRNRKLSSSSNVSVPNSPFAPFAQAAHGRSPSLNSEYSIGGSRMPRPAFNFSRPISRASGPSMDMPRQPSFDSRPSMDQPRPFFSQESRQTSSDSQRFLFVDDTVQTPMSMDDGNDSDVATSSYIYSKFALPRGRMTQRSSKESPTSDVPYLERERSNQYPGPKPMTPLANRPMSPGSPSSLRSPRPSVEQQPKLSFQESNRMRPPPTPVADDNASQYTTSTRSDATIKPGSRQIAAMSTNLTAEDHLAKGIALHEKGEGRESTYHLRIAAKQNNPTAMLLYALACRHGWGMRPNEQEGVQWLRKAADSASVELAGDEDSKSGNFEERKQRRAQFALSIYELGQSHYNGWGIEQDRVLALRCFEIAANWGDADAMAEAGFCYVKGEGTKKDLKKAAKYYRMAEAKGMSMVGNSWIYKPKYADDTSEKGHNDRRGRGGAKDSTPEKKPRDKSRTRTIFGRKKSVSQQRP